MDNNIIIILAIAVILVVIWGTALAFSVIKAKKSKH